MTTATLARPSVHGHLQSHVVSFLLGAAALVALAVIVGGGTRLTESGLSITEWNVVSGILPPLDATVWLDEFEKYRRTVQYRELNQGMTLGDFKVIYLWEWAHRIIGRVIGLWFLGGFLFFWWRGAFATGDRLFRRLLLIGLLIALQGAVGWWMVNSGLFDRVNVAPYRLAIHLSLACFIFACLVATAHQLRHGAKAPEQRATAGPWPRLLLAVIFLQIFFGALVAGNRAGYAYQTWPLMGDSFIPATLLEMTPLWRNLFENAALVQFIHRMTAYALVFLAAVNLSAAVRQGRGSVTGSAVILTIAIACQAGLGIATLLSGMNILVALAHQAGILVVLTLAIRHAQDCRGSYTLAASPRA